jgi:type IV secretory pathway VirB2 component (pilin)
MKNILSIKPAKIVTTPALAALAVIGLALEAQAGGTGLPWDGPIEKLSAGLSGPVAFMFALGGMVVLGVRWIFGGEMGAMTRSLLTAISGIALLVFAADFLAGLFGVSSALMIQ